MLGVGEIPATVYESAGLRQMEPLDPRKLKLLIPDIWDTEWVEAIEEAEGLDEFLLSIQARAAHLLKPINDYDVTFERLAWLSLWTRAFSILDGVRAAILRESIFLLQVLARMEFELVLHTHTILASDPVDRLRAYCAWCISNDRSFQRKVVDPKTLDAVWDVEPVRQLIENPSDLEIHERLFGPLPEEMDIDEHEARRSRFRQQDRERHKTSNCH